MMQFDWIRFKAYFIQLFDIYFGMNYNYFSRIRDQRWLSSKDIDKLRKEHELKLFLEATNTIKTAVYRS